MLHLPLKVILMLTYVPCMHVALLYLRGTTYYYTINDVTILSKLHDSPPRSHTCLLPYYFSFPRSRILLDYSYYCYFFAPPITSPLWSYFGHALCLWGRIGILPYHSTSVLSALALRTLRIFTAFHAWILPTIFWGLLFVVFRCRGSVCIGISK